MFTSLSKVQIPSFSFGLALLQCLMDLDWVSRQVEVSVVGLQVTYRTVSSCHAEALDEQLCNREI